MERKPVSSLTKTLLMLGAVCALSIFSVYTLRNTPPQDSLTEYLKEKRALDSTYSAKQEQSLDSLSAWYETTAESLKTEYGMGKSSPLCKQGTYVLGKTEN
jgi:hypothetical protein